MSQPPPRKRRRIELHLPGEMLLEIARRVTTASALLNMFRVSKPWNEGLKPYEEQLWEHFVKRDFPGKKVSFFELFSRDLYFDRLTTLVDSMRGFAEACYGYSTNSEKGQASLSSMDECVSFEICRRDMFSPWMCSDEDLNIKVTPLMETYEKCTLREIIHWVLFEREPRARCDYVFDDVDGTVEIGVSWTNRRRPDFMHSSSGPVHLSDSSESEDD